MFKELKITSVKPLGKQKVYDLTAEGCHHYVGNGILLCSSCHHDYHKAYEGAENVVTLAKFMKEFGQFQ